MWSQKRCPYRPESLCHWHFVLTPLPVTYEHTILLEWILSAQFSVSQNFNLFPCFTVLIKFFFLFFECLFLIYYLLSLCLLFN